MCSASETLSETCAGTPPAAHIGCDQWCLGPSGGRQKVSTTDPLSTGSTGVIWALSFSGMSCMEFVGHEVVWVELGVIMGRRRIRENPSHNSPFHTVVHLGHFLR